MASGVQVADSVIQAFSDLKSGHKFRYVMFKVGDDVKEIVVDSTVVSATYEEFLEALPAEEPRYIAYDFWYELGDSGKREDVIFFSW